MKFKPFKPEHIKLMNLRDFDQKCIESYGNDYDEILDAMTMQGPSFTLSYKDQLLASGGVVVLWDGVGEAWLTTDEAADRYPIAFYKGVKEKLEEIAKILNLHRVQMNVIEGHDTSCRWLMRMGYRFEGLMKAFGPDKTNYIRFARVF